MKSAERRRASYLTASMPFLAAMMLTTGAEAQSSPSGAHDLPAVVVDKPQAAARRAKPSASRRAARRQAVHASRRNAPSNPATVPAAAEAVETATGHVDGYVATRSGTGSKTDTLLRETPQSISVVTADEVRDQGVVNVQEALRYVPGVFADAYGRDSRGDYPRFRGQDPNIYLDGTRVIDTYRFNEWRIDPYTLERIEVLRGPSSVLYGDTSTAGLLNRISKLPQA